MTSHLPAGPGVEVDVLELEDHGRPGPGRIGVKLRLLDRHAGRLAHR